LEPVITFGYRHSNGTDLSWSYNGTNDPETGGWKEMHPITDLVVFTGGGILGTLPTPTCASGTRDATIKPSQAPYVIPQCYVESGDTMYITYAGHNQNRYAFGVFVYGECSSDVYTECWDDNTFSTTDLELLQGTSNNGGVSCINAIRTTYTEPPWAPGWDGNSDGGAFLRGTESRVALGNSSTITDQALYFNIYVELPTDVGTFHATPVLAIRYLYT
jgi:hypothetical protein